MKKDADAYIIRVVSKEHNTWQGTVEWVEKKQTIGFRSTLELIHLLDSVVVDHMQVAGDRQEP